MDFSNELTCHFSILLNVIHTINKKCLKASANSHMFIFCLPDPQLLGNRARNNVRWHMELQNTELNRSLPMVENFPTAL